MDIIDFTSFSEIRACLGVTEEELENSTLELQMYELGLGAELRDIGEDLAADFATIDLIEEGSRTNLQAKLHGTVKLFAPYAVARQLLPALPLFAPKSITDGKAAVSRDSASPYKDTIEQVNADYARYRRLLVDVYAEVEGGSVDPVVYQRSYLLAVTPTSDPVIGT